MEVNVNHISHQYGEVTVLRDIDFQIQDQEILAIVGPSGCGKSTLLGVIGGIISPTQGTVSHSGIVSSRSLNPFTYVFQDFALLPWRTVRANVELVLEHHALNVQQRRELVDDALKRMGILEFAEAFPGRLSGGMRQRVGIARALVVSPALLLLDEPLSALDAQTREILTEDFLSIWLEQRTTAVLVTHNLHEACALADRVAVLSRRPGRLREIVSVPVAREDRRKVAASGELTKLYEKLWGLIRDEAISAEREVG